MPHPTLSHIWPAAGLAEREIFDLLGLPFAGNENLAPLFLEEQFAGFPLRRDYQPPARADFASDLLRERHETAMLDALVGADPRVRPADGEVATGPRPAGENGPAQGTAPTEEEPPAEPEDGGGEA